MEILRGPSAVLDKDYKLSQSCIQNVSELDNDNELEITVTVDAADAPNHIRLYVDGERATQFASALQRRIITVPGKERHMIMVTSRRTTAYSINITGGGDLDGDGEMPAPGDRVVLLVSNPREATNLPAGTCGTVLCIDSSDPDLPILVSWDGWSGGYNRDSFCDVPPGYYPNNSAYWMAFDQIALGCTEGDGESSCCDPRYLPGDRVQLLVYNPRDAVGLPAGALGTVLCCDSDDPDLPIFVSWDGWSNGYNRDSFCDVPPEPYPNNSAYWMACDQISPFTETRETAYNPVPADGAIDVSRDVVLSWTPGIYATSHIIYFSENFNDVKDGIGGIPQSESSYAPGSLDFGTTYYWRVDEVSGPPNYTVSEGEVWSFTVTAGG